MQLGEFRQQYPEYNAWSDADLAEALYKKYYSDRDRGAFYSAIGVPFSPLKPEEEAPPEPEEEESFLESAYNIASDAMAGMGAAFAMTPVSAIKGTAAVLGADVEGGFVSGLSETEQDIQEYFGGDPGTVSYKLGAAIGSMGAFVATSVLSVLATPVTGGASAAGIGAAGASLLARFAPLAIKYGPAMGVGAADQVDRLRAMGDELGDVDEIDRRLSMALGYAVGWTEMWPVRFPVGSVLARLKKSTPDWAVDGYVGTILRGLQTGGKEGLQEAAAQVMQNAIAKGFYDPDLDITESAAENFGYGAAAGTILNTVLELALPRTRRKTKKQEDAEIAAAAVAAEGEAARTVLGGADQEAAKAAMEVAVGGVAPERADIIRTVLERARQDFVDFGGVGGQMHDEVREAIRTEYGEGEANAYAAEVDRLRRQVASSRVIEETAPARAAVEEEIAPVLAAEEIAPVPEGPIQPTFPGFEDMRLEFASEDVISADVDGVDVATRIVSDFAEFLPIALDKGSVSVNEEGNPDVYRVAEDDAGRFFVETKNEVKASPYLSTREQAETVRGEMNSRVPEIFRRQDEAETEVLAREAVAQARGSERALLLAAARKINSPAAKPTVLFGDLAGTTQTLINRRRISTGRVELREGNPVSIEELSDSGLSEESIADLLPDPVVEYTANDVIERVQVKGYRTDDEGFSRWARRGAGGDDLGGMTKSQLQQLVSEADNLPSLPMVEGKLVSLPVVRAPKVSTQQYASVINMARLKPARPERGLGEGEILKSDINDVLGVRTGLAKDIVEEALRRGDLVRSPTKRNAFVVRDRAREAGIEPVEEVAVEVDEFGQLELPGLKVRRSEIGPSPEARAAAAADFKSIIDKATIKQDVLDIPALGGLGIPKLMQIFSRRLRGVKGMEASPIALDIVRTLGGGADVREGVFDPAKMAIAIALDGIPDPKASRKDIVRDLVQVLDHETIHAVKALGVFSDAEWRTLTNFVKRVGLRKDKESPVVTYYNEAASLYSKLTEAELVEEAIANLFGDYGRNLSVLPGEEQQKFYTARTGKQLSLSGKPLNLLQRIVSFFINLRRGLDDVDVNDMRQVFAGLTAPGRRVIAATPVVDAKEEALAQEIGGEAGQRLADAPAETLEARYAVRRTTRGDILVPREEIDAREERERREAAAAEAAEARAAPARVDRGVERRGTEGVVRRADVGGELTGEGRKTTEFFGNITRGLAGQPNLRRDYDPVIQLGRTQPETVVFDEEYQRHLGNFDLHIATSIPGFREVQAAVGHAIVRTLPQGGTVLDIGASEGALVKSVAAMSGGRVAATALDPNVAMSQTFLSGEQVPGADYRVEAFGTKGDEGRLAWTEDDGTPIPYFKPDRKYDIVHESMVFQFISGERDGQIRRMKELATDDGLIIIEEKFTPGIALSQGQWEASEAQKDDFKHQYFTPSETTKKKETILVGMHDLMVSPGEVEGTMANNFNHVVQFWDSGNFKGYVASDSRQRLDAFLGNLEDLNTEFSTTPTPREVDITRDVAAVPQRLFAVRRLRRTPRPRDPINTIQSSLNDDMVVADKLLSKRARALSALDLIYNEELLPETGAGIGEVAERLQRRTLRILKSAVDIVTDQSKDGLISDALAAETLRALQETGNAADWYTSKVAEAMRVVEELHPEIATDPDARFLFMVSMAITSQKTPVLNNAQYAEEAYNDYQRNGRFSNKGWGDAAPSMRGNFERLNDLIEMLGVSGVRDLFDQ